MSGCMAYFSLSEKEYDSPPSNKSEVWWWNNGCAKD